MSSTTVSMAPLASSASGPLIRMPSWPPRPTPTIRAVGVARPRAQGQAMISTDSAALNEVRGPAPDSSQAARVTSAMPITVGTNTATTLSTRVWTRALRACAWSAVAAIWASWVWAPTCRASMINAPVLLMVPPGTRSPSAACSGIGSPVIIEVSTAECPTQTVPSVAIRSPGRTRNRSPTRSSPSGTTTSRPSRITRTVVGARSPSALSTLRADRLERASK
ncbi:hypothetical protein SDC9_122458 [bioreactor metagenome]|uniref:Uncharacterized protein n=1 Tax=bioreactor metagenome TaxID=1076179 RepID=A0A645CEY6_9ZZZZ